MSLPPVASREQWLTARKELLARERELTRLQDALNADRGRLPMVRIDKHYVFAGPAGPVTLPGLFDGCRQLIVQHFMFDPDWDSGCPSCAASADELSNGVITQLRARDTAFAMVSRAPIAKITSFRERRGWGFPWYSSHGSDFNYDFHLTLDEEKAPVVYDYQSKAEILAAHEDNDLVLAEQPVEVPGISCFLQAEDRVFHTYSTYARGMEHVSAVRGYLALTALGVPAD